MQSPAAALLGPWFAEWATAQPANLHSVTSVGQASPSSEKVTLDQIATQAIKTLGTQIIWTIVILQGSLQKVMVSAFAHVIF